MRICFIHQNLPAQFRHLIDALLARGDEVVAIADEAAMRRWRVEHPRLRRLAYRIGEPKAPAPVSEFDRMAARGRAVAKALRLLIEDGRRPDLIVAHPGWGEMMFLRSELPDTPLLGYCEFFYRDRGSDVGFDPEHPAEAGVAQRLQWRRAVLLLALQDMDAGLAPTAWQRDQHPAEYRDKIELIHDGIDTDAVRPDASAEVTLGGLTLRRGDPVVTYVARGLEPYRGFHIFMRSLPELLRRSPKAIVVIAGSDAVSYGRRLAEGDSHRARLLAELAKQGQPLDLSRIVFAGRLAYAQYLRLLQVSAVHVYLTYPFVLSWSLLEAMAAGACIVGSRTPPVQEVIADGVNGLLIDFFDAPGLAAAVAEALDGRVDRAALGAAARRTVVERFDLRRRCLPAGLALIDRLAGAAAGRSPG